MHTNLRRIIASRIDADQSPVCADGVDGTMPAFIYRCPNTGIRIQALVAEEIAQDEDAYQPVTCVMCGKVHFVNPFTGKVLGRDDDK